VRRVAPRPIGRALESAVGDARPAGLLASVQSAWPTAAGATVGASTTPVSEQAGVVTVACESGAWAQELELLAPDLVGRLNDELPGGGGLGRVERLRFVVRSGLND
jgi:hypothetical protein